MNLRFANLYLHLIIRLYQSIKLSLIRNRITERALRRKKISINKLLKKEVIFQEQATRLRITTFILLRYSLSLQN